MQLDSIQPMAPALRSSVALVPNASSSSSNETDSSVAGTRPETKPDAPYPANLNGNKDVEEAINSFNEVAVPPGISLKFSRDDKTHRIVVEMVDQTTGETLRQMPDAATLRLSAMLGKLEGLIVDRQM